MRNEKLDRINELSRKSKEQALNKDELDEQKKLRDEYISEYRNSLRSQLDKIVIVEKDGSKKPLKPKK